MKIAKSGLDVGIKDRSHKYVSIVCSQCSKERWVKLSDTQKPKFTNTCRHCRNQNRANNPNWRGGIIKDKGYIRHYEPNHPRATQGGYVYEHILIWEQVHNKSLPRGWVVHHLNGIKNDNRPENLMGMLDKRHRFILAEKSKRIRGLEARVKLLERALETNQMIFKVGEG